MTDASGAPLPCVPVTFTAPASGASGMLSAGTVTTNGAGQATVSVTANGTLGSYAITVSVPGGVTAASIPLANGFPVAAQGIPAVGNPALAVLVLALGAFAWWTSRRAKLGTVEPP